MQLTMSRSRGLLDTRITIVGCGTMGSALAAGFAAHRGRGSIDCVLLDRIPELSAALAARVGGRAAATLDVALQDATMLLLCVKPADVPRLLSDIVRTRACLAEGGTQVPHQLVLSIAAGVRLSQLEEALGDDPGVAVVRAMPNTGCAIGRGTTVLARGTRATEEDVAKARALFERAGTVLTLEERYLDAVTALSGSGPAFIYLILEALADGGMRCGLARSHALALAAQMTVGAAELVLAGGKHPAVLRDEVATPGGCTVAGLAALEDGGVRSALARAVEVTSRRAAELGGPGR